MKIRRSARTILVTLLILSVFTFITVWHNKAPGTLSEQDKQALIKDLAQKNPGLSLFLENMMQGNDITSFYAVGKSSTHPWPESISRASYSDPLARQAQSSGTEILIRYRSSEDFLFILQEAEKRTPGTLAALNYDDYQAIPEPALTISFRLLVSLLVGVSGLILIRYFNR
ncbi:MAG: hypothetical protein HOB84_02020 [Candidatus Marinimicrobia bacterium]|jgi:hypothetical protein|nr:hypothetical protein [Candidatus Neomarinimicrobiota bacterium]MBT4361109.1 hypothetical protein [Candidatus Neomarinimicrobiota bacterium]MBT4713531.1 hypothetical protein [Candidatus Neomarinimicrobiota bacterium]MBT4946657.1 hypothetical protein [Candidatus Neomarinimicrobiota bacterium]MBT5268652.1 hypothetical protein [Candidatus Neomarinimicrobiota bacterium]